MILGRRFDEALMLAVSLHRGDVRKKKETPYLAHVLGVCALVLHDGGNEDEAIGALLHDVLEDHPEELGAEEIETRFGSTVADIVRSCTDTPPDYEGGPKPPWRERKEHYLAELLHATLAAQRVSLADKLDNVREIIVDLRKDDPTVWCRFTVGRDLQLWYYRGVLEVLQFNWRGGFLLSEYERTLRDLEVLAAETGG